VLSAAVEGLQRAEARLGKAAENLARLPLSATSSQPPDQVDLSSEVVALLQARHAHAANLKVIQTADEMQQRLLDVLG